MRRHERRSRRRSVGRRPEAMNRPRASLPFYPILLVASFLLATFFDADVSPYAALRAFGVVLLGATLISLVAVVLLGRMWGGLVAVALFMIARPGDPIHVAAAVVLVVAVAGFWRLSRRLWPRAEVLREPTGALNLMAAFLLLATVGSAALDGTLMRMEIAVASGPESLTADTTHASRPPDIYVILLDGYPRADTLQRLFDYDNTPFLDELRQRGFDVSDEPTSNYMYTDLTLTSMFHMEYVDQIANRNDVSVPYGVSLRYAINHNPVWDDLRSHGYLVAATKAPWEEVALRSADVLCGVAPNDFELFLVRTTLAGRLLAMVDPAIEADSHRAAVDDAFDCLGRMAQPTNQPKLVFVHVGSPHLPVVFTADGKAASGDVFGYTSADPVASRAAFEAAYVDQVRYLNRKVLAAVLPLIQRPDDPVVILMSDHGSEIGLDWGNAIASDLRERFSSFFVARTPGHPLLFGQGPTPVQVFPTLLNAYLSEEVRIPQARYFMSTPQDELTLTEIPRPDAPPRAAAADTVRED